ncbi:hypothetical protein HU200_003564 [Digitaria exilis]|uniref:non-specific serine/threonine protein kinase n=1 Tax=Digitaria exilis TaxID=1010633 RepID=A0A835FXE2_9POAL|nr:hypothetical protein HU200_003564 [Digitaria exilis]
MPGINHGSYSTRIDSRMTRKVKYCVRPGSLQEVMQSLQFTYKRYSNRMPIPFHGFAILLLISLATLTTSCKEQENNSLLQFLSGLSNDAGLAKSWQEGTDCCRWEGITCNGSKTVIEVSLASRGLEGNISQSLENLTGLQLLNLSCNSLSGGLPLGLVSSRSVIVLDVSFNQLNGDLHELPSQIPGQPLQVLNISSNLFTGQFTSTTWKGMENLIALNASNNSFTGQLPSHFCSISPSLAVLELCYNKLSGSIPPGLGNCSKLRVLKAGHNNLSGTLPDDLFNATLLEYLSFSSNSLQGMFDGMDIVKLSNLAILDLGENKFGGNIPDSIGQLKRLQEFHLDYNSMFGELPSTLNNCTELITLDLKGNIFSGELNKVNFSNLPNLKTLDLMRNNFSGLIPESIYSCRNLTALRLSSSKFGGQLSSGVNNLKSLSFLSLTNNSFSNITNALQILRNSKKLTTLFLGANFKNENMPEDARLDGFETLQVLGIEECLLSGEIPLWISELANLEMLFLGGNRLSGPIPIWINTLNYLFFLDISNNSLTGEIPASLVNLTMLTSERTTAYLDPMVFSLPVYDGPSRQYRIPVAFPKVLNLSSNKLTGMIPPEIGHLKALVSLDFSSNNLTGPIPPSICNLTNLQVLDLSNNNLTGAIPSALENLNFLSAFNISNNNLEGPVPTGGQFNTFQSSSFDGNPKLCGSMLGRRCSSADEPLVSKTGRNKKAIFVIAFVCVFFTVIAILFLLGRILVSIRVKRLTAKSGRGDNSDVEETSFNSRSEHELIMMPHGKTDRNTLTFSDIVKGTNNFDKEHIIGCGGYGLVYKAELPDGCKLAIKKLNGDMCLMEREFTAEVQALSMAKHDHLVPLWGYCSQGNSRFLIYSFMENGSLDDWLHNRDDDASTFLDWSMRLGIAQGASRGLSYIHNVCKPHIVHRDIKSSNILLDKELKAYVADFGLSRLILPNKTHVTTELVGTLGYIPPEYAHGWVATLRGDIYSFGVVLLELLTGLRPVPVLSTSKELVPWVLEMRSQGKQIEVLDPTLRGTGHEEQMLKVLEVACKCVNYNPSMRPPIMEVVSCLESINTGLQTQKSVKAQCTRCSRGVSFGALPSSAPNSPRTSVAALGNERGTQWHGALPPAAKVKGDSRLFQQEAMQPNHFSYKKCSSRLPIPSLGLVIVLLVSLASPTSSCTELDKASLLLFLGGLSQDAGLAKSWQEGTDCCKWEGVACNRNGTVTRVSLASRGLQGRISPSLGNLTSLEHLNLSYNMLSGGLPPGLVSSSSIIVLDVSFNQLTGDLHDLPSSTADQPLEVLNISSNMFTGKFTSRTWEGMTNLVAFNASNNSFTGELPGHFCNISPSFAVLELCCNKFSGRIPPGLGNCSKLRVLKAGHNRLSGSIPDELFNSTSLEQLSFPNNGLDGVLEGARIVNLIDLVALDLGRNKFTGNIPDSIGQLKRLEELHLENNNMSEELPSSLGNCTNLRTIGLKSNKFSGELRKVNFSTLHNLQTLDLLYNNFTGTIPESIYSCRNLTALRLSSNNLHGQLSPRMGNLESLTFLSLSGNNFTNITNTLQILKSCPNLTTLLLGSNFRGELLPQDDTFNGFENIQVLAIEECLLSGNIPLWISKIANLEMLLLAGNRLSGTIPTWISTLNYLFYLDISNNSLTGEIPTSLMNMPMLISERTTANLDPRVFGLPVYNGPSRQYRISIAFPKVLNLSSNKLTGVIPPEIGQLKALVSLDISFNNLEGPIPNSICNLTNLQVLDLSNNNLTGAIPSALENLHFLSAFNISNNNLEGPIPTGGQFSTFHNSSFDGNPKLCSPLLGRRCSSADAPLVPTKGTDNEVIIAIAFGTFFAVISILVFLWRLLAAIKVKRLAAKSAAVANGDVETTLSNSSQEHTLVTMLGSKAEENKLTFPDIIKATNNFDTEHIIGCGGYGLVYKAELPDGCKLAIKKLNGEMCLMEREFTAEVEVLSMAQHDNLVPLWGYCVQGDSWFLIYSFMENGSLDDWLHNRDDDASTFLDWPTRLKIAQGASHGLSYIHNVCKPHIVHRDIKSSNILLDKDFKARVADFGLSRLILSSKTHVTTELVGTLGYIPPEYGQGFVATLRGDIYSFGFVLLELLTGLGPIPVLSTSKELVPWALEMRSQGRQIEVLDPTLRGIGHEEQMLKVLEVACKCVNYNPSLRPPIMQVVTFLESIHDGRQM